MHSESIEYLPEGTKLKPMRDRILLKPLPWDASKTLIAIRHGRPVRGVVVAVGPGEHVKKYRENRSKYVLSNHFTPTDLQPGEIVELGGLNVFDGQGYAFPQFMIGTELHIMCQEKDVAIVRDDESP